MLSSNQGFLAYDIETDSTDITASCFTHRSTSPHKNPKRIHLQGTKEQSLSRHCRRHHFRGIHSFLLQCYI